MIRPEIRDLLLSLPGDPPIVAIDGRGSSGKTTPARRPARITPGAAVVHTGDIAWAHAVLDRTDLLIDGIIRPVRAGATVGRGRDHARGLRRLGGRGDAVRRAGAHLGTGAADGRRAQPARR